MGTGWNYEIIGQLTLPDALDIFEYWKDFPPVHELMRVSTGYQRPMTTEEKIKEGAMGPEDFLAHYRATKGKLTP